jgi:hypothetical protein
MAFRDIYRRQVALLMRTLLLIAEERRPSRHGCEELGPIVLGLNLIISKYGRLWIVFRYDERKVSAVFADMPSELKSLSQ